MGGIVEVGQELQAVGDRIVVVGNSKGCRRVVGQVGGLAIPSIIDR